MSKKVYIKDESFDPIYKEVSRGFYAKSRILPSLLIFAGLFVFSTQVVLPAMVFKTQDETSAIINNGTVLGRLAGFSKFEFKELKNINSQVEISKPINRDEPQMDKAKSKESAVAYDISTNPNDYNYNPRENTQILGSEDVNTPEFFYLTVPKLGIENAKVEVNAKTLDPVSALGHYTGTELPGEVGNTFIFGHSVLPWFFNSKNYKTIFSTLGRLEIGDELFVNYNNKKLIYKVELIEELSPKDVQPLADLKPQYLNESTMVLMTCSPPGTKLKRLLVNAVLVD